jgi:hypothetical protein
MKKVTAWITAFSLFGAFTFMSCDKSSEDNLQLANRGIVGTTTGGSQIGTQGTTPNGQTFRAIVYFDSLHLVTLMQQLTPDQINKVSKNGMPMGVIYVTSDLHVTGTFLPITPAFVGPDQNPYWRVQQITFNAGYTPRQFAYASDVEAAVLTGEITLTATGDVYWYEIIGKY